MLKVFIGWDSREDIAYQVCKYSIESRASIPVEIIPIKQDLLRKEGIYTREVDNLSSTEFTFTRFFVPYLSNFSGQSIFCDCDFLWLIDIKELANFSFYDHWKDQQNAVNVVQHNYNPTETIKGTGAQYNYPRKNWSSMVMWDCENPSNMILTPEFLNKASPQTLHRFKWLRDNQIGNLPPEYNWLEGHHEEPRDGTPKVIHYTRGGCWFKDYQNVGYVDLWKKEYKSMTGQDWPGF